MPPPRMMRSGQKYDSRRARYALNSRAQRFQPILPRPPHTGPAELRAERGAHDRRPPARPPAETQGWVDSLDSIVETGGGKERAQFILYRLLKRARQLQIGLPPPPPTRYLHTH